MPLIAKFRKNHKKASVRMTKMHLVVQLTNYGSEVATFLEPLMDEQGALAKARQYVYGV